METKEREELIKEVDILKKSIREINEKLPIIKDKKEYQLAMCDLHCMQYELLALMSQL